MLLHGVMPAQVCLFLPNFTRSLIARLAEILFNARPVYSPEYRVTCFATHFAVIHKQNGTFPPIIQINDENVKQYLHQYQLPKCSHSLDIMLYTSVLWDIQWNCFPTCVVATSPSCFKKPCQNTWLSQGKQNYLPFVASSTATGASLHNVIGLVLYKAMIAVINHIIYLAVPNNGFQEDLFHNLSRNWDETVLFSGYPSFPSWK